MKCKKGKKISSFFEDLPAKLENLKHSTLFFSLYHCLMEKKKKDREKRERKDLTGRRIPFSLHLPNNWYCFSRSPSQNLPAIQSLKLFLKMLVPTTTADQNLVISNLWSRGLGGGWWAESMLCLDSSLGFTGLGNHSLNLCCLLSFCPTSLWFHKE